LGLSFTFHGLADGRSSGELWVDDVSFLSGAPAPAAEPASSEPGAVEEAAEPESEPIEEETEEAENGRSGLCAGSTTMGLIAVVAGVWVTTAGKRRANKTV
jgi:hypothetical protein